MLANKIIQQVILFTLFLTSSYGKPSEEVFYARLKWSDLVTLSKPFSDLKNKDLFGGDVLDVSKICEKHGIEIGQNELALYFVKNSIVFISSEKDAAKSARDLFGVNATTIETYRIQAFTSSDESEETIKTNIKDNLIFSSLTKSGRVVSFGDGHGKTLDLVITKGINKDGETKFELSTSGVLSLLGKNTVIDVTKMVEIPSSTRIEKILIDGEDETWLMCKVEVQSSIVSFSSTLDLEGSDGTALITKIKNNIKK